MRKILCVLLSAVLAVSALSGCAVQKNPDADDGKLHVVTTIFAPYDFARQVGGDDVSVTMLLRPGCEVHAYEPHAEGHHRHPQCRCVYLRRRRVGCVGCRRCSREWITPICVS